MLTWRMLTSGQYKSSIWNGKRHGDGRRRYKLGLYKTACDAALAYDRAAVAINGESALTNFPPPPSHARQDSCGIRKLLEAKALTDSEGSDGEDDSWERSPQPLSRIERPLKRPRVGAGQQFRRSLVGVQSNSCPAFCPWPLFPPGWDS